jgi:quercetin dioxygenase-like cupin family protein
VEPGSLIYMTPDLSHGVRAESELIMLLSMVKSTL